MLGRRFSGQFRAGDPVLVRSAAEIIQTLDENGSLDGLPFMPEMVEFCGQSARVLRRVEKICVEGYPDTFRAFENNDVVLLDSARCSGANHDRCSRGCTLLWKEAWLWRRQDGDSAPRPSGRADDPAAVAALHSRLRTHKPGGGYSCQSTELCSATRPLSRRSRIWVCFREVRVGNRGPFEMAGLIARFFWRRLRRKIFGWRPRGVGTQTPNQALGLQAGEWVEVKPLSEIRATLDRNGFNRGLDFSHAMRQFCGRQFQVRSRMDRRIDEATGEMRVLKNTVTLEGVECQCYYRFGGCPRGDLLYWREVWLKRSTQSQAEVARIPSAGER